MNTADQNIFKINISRAKKYIHRVLDVPTYNDKASRAFDDFMITLIVLNMIAMLLQTSDSIAAAGHFIFTILEIFTIVVFTIEYALRVWSITVNHKYSKPFWGRARFCLKPLMIVDLIAFLPFYLPLAGMDLRYARILKLFRLIKIVRYSSTLRFFGKIIYKKREELLITMSLLFVILILCSLLIYDVENKVNQAVFPGILDAFWW
ncbi:MAG: ion transporter, partial [Candidatus Gastranaerophilales bacterium]|nr:ion transporter [Candidatus Gastranaerophilales bacterium]